MLAVINDCLKNNFRHILKNAEITTCFKKEDKNEKENYGPVGILSNFSNVLERLIYHPLNEFMGTKFSKFFTGFRKNHNTEYAQKTQLTKRNKIGVIITDLCKVKSQPTCCKT